MEVEGDRELTITCGATEAMASVLLALVDPDDEVIVLEPFYENCTGRTRSCAAPARSSLSPWIHSRLPARSRPPARALVTPRTRAIIVNTPNNPTGRVLDHAGGDGGDPLSVCVEHDLLAITDEIYEHIYYEGEHIPLAMLDGMRERSVVVSSASKTFSVTGWRVGWVVAPPGASPARSGRCTTSSPWVRPRACRKAWRPRSTGSTSASIATWPARTRRGATCSKARSTTPASAR